MVTGTWIKDCDLVPVGALLTDGAIDGGSIRFNFVSQCTPSNPALLDVVDVRQLQKYTPSPIRKQL